MQSQSETTSYHSSFAYHRNTAGHTHTRSAAQYVPTEDINYLMLLHDLYLAFYSLNLSTNESYNFSPSPL